MNRQPLLITMVCLAILSGVAAAQQTLRMDHVVVSHTGIGEEYARAIGRTIAAARAVASERYGFDMPETIVATVTVDPKGRTRLFTDGKDRIFLTVRSQRDLRQPRASGVFHLYGMCHEVGHLAMYRPINNHNWMTTPAAEGWAHWLGSQIVDDVYKREGPDLWPDRYDYRSDGTERLVRQFASPRPNETHEGARRWDALHKLVGDRGIMPIFEAWGKTEFDPADPTAALSKALESAASQKDVSSWWGKAVGTFVKKRPKSEFTSQTVSAGQLIGQPRELTHDDGRQAKKKSIAGGGHAVKFASPGDSSWYVTSVKIFGGRYGRSSSRDRFQVWICDENFRSIAGHKFSYAKISYGSPRWNTLKLKPTRVTSEFIVCVGFNPSATKGVFVGYDAKSSGYSLGGLPGRTPKEFGAGDWMIRVTVDQLKKTTEKSSSRSLRMRQWTSADGKFKTQAKYLKLKDDKVRLEKSNGEVIEVSLEKLSPADRRYVRRLQGIQEER